MLDNTVQRRARLWRSDIILAASFVFGAAATLVLAAISWRRMGLHDKARVYSLWGTIAAVTVVIPIVLLTPTIVGLGLNLGLAVALWRGIKRDMAAFTAAGHVVEEASQWQALLISLAVLGPVFVIVGVEGVVLELLGATIPD